MRRVNEILIASVEWLEACERRARAASRAGDGSHAVAPDQRLSRSDTANPFGLDEPDQIQQCW